MMVLCRHGHYAFYPERASEVFDFRGRYGPKFALTRPPGYDFYTFEALAKAPAWSLRTVPFLNLPALFSFEGRPWEVMRENKFVWSLGLGLLVPTAAVVKMVGLAAVNGVYSSGGSFIQAGARDKLGRAILSYAGRMSVRHDTLDITEVEWGTI